MKEAGNKYFGNGEYELAWQLYSDAVKAEPENVVCLANRAQCELKLELFGSAVVTCNEALKIDPNFVKCYYRRAIAYGGVLEYSKAVKDFQKVVSLAPSFKEGRAKLQAAQALARYVTFQLAIKGDDEPSFLDKLDLDAMKSDESEQTKIDLDLDNLDDASIERVVAHFKEGKRLPKPLLFEIIVRVARILKSEPTMTEFNVPENNVLTVCGDTHGQFFDLLHIFETNGWPTEEHAYLFNGDFVDRGSWSTEVAILLYLLKLRFPTTLLLNRGNHETDSMNTAYGFAGECQAKYGTPQMFKAFSESFSLLPLACLINGHYFVVHGGIFSEEGVTLDDIRKVERFANKQPPLSGLIMEMLWADPKTTKGIGPSRRGIGHEFGPDITAAFVEANGLKGVIRSHEVRQGGYAEEHNGKLVTIFSAPNYCDSVGNKGAFINIGSDSVLKFEQFTASWHPNVPPMAYASGLMR